MAEMTDDDLKSLLDARFRAADAYWTDELAADLETALDYYHGRPLGDEVPNRSQIRTRDVFEVIEWLMPELMRVFTASPRLCDFEPGGPGDAEAAEQASDYVNYVFWQDNDGFLLLYQWLKDALLLRNGILKCVWETADEEPTESYENLTGDQLMGLMLDPERELVSVTETEPQGAGREPQGASPSQGASPALTAEFIRHNAGRVRLEVVPLEEFRISPDARGPRVEQAPYSCHVRTLTRSDLRAMGYEDEDLDDLPPAHEAGSDRALGGANGRLAARGRAEGVDAVWGSHPATGRTAPDRAMQELEVREHYLQVDVDGDGLAELRRVLEVGGTILENEVIDRAPWHVISPVMMPHQFAGLSMFDLVKDLQELRTVLWRQTLDNIYLTNAPRTIVNQNVNIPDLQAVRPGGVVRTRGIPAQDVAPFPVAPIAGQTFEMLGTLTEARQERAGVGQRTQGLDPDVLQNVTATAAAKQAEYVRARIELMVRVIAQTGLTSLANHLYELLHKHQDRARVVKLRDSWVNVRPSEWAERVNARINVGLGTGSKTERLGNLQLVIAAQERLAPLGLVGPEQMYNTAEVIAELAGYRDPTKFFKDPRTMPPQGAPQGPPDPQAALIAAQREVELAKVSSRAQSDQARLAFDQQKLAEEMRLKWDEQQRKWQETQAELQKLMGQLSARLGPPPM